MVLGAALVTDGAWGRASQKTEFQAAQLRPPVWMIGEYYVVTQANGDQYLYVIPTVYNKIGPTNPYTPKNGSIVQMYAQFEAPGDVIKPRDEDNPFYESWSCNMKYYSNLENNKKSDIV